MKSVLGPLGNPAWFAESPDFYAGSQVPATALAACSGALGWPIVVYRSLCARCRLSALRKVKGRVCKPRFSARNVTFRRACVSATVIAAIVRASRAFASVWTANITARTAGRLAKSASWLNPMTNDPVRVVFHLDQDWRLVGVFCCAVEHQAIHAGFESEAGAQLAKAAGDVCRETISQLGGNGDGVDVTLDTFSDRIEIDIHCRGQVLPALGLEKFAISDAHAERGGGVNGQELLSQVDRVLYNAEGGVARTTLVKFLPSHR
jgi:hypothetical protein